MMSEKRLTLSVRTDNEDASPDRRDETIEVVCLAIETYIKNRRNTKDVSLYSILVDKILASGLCSNSVRELICEMKELLDDGRPIRMKLKNLRLLQRIVEGK